MGAGGERRTQNFIICNLHEVSLGWSKQWGYNGWDMWRACWRREMFTEFGWESLGHRFYCVMVERFLSLCRSLKMKNLVIWVSHCSHYEFYLLRAQIPKHFPFFLAPALVLQSLTIFSVRLIFYSEEKGSTFHRTDFTASHSQIR